MARTVTDKDHQIRANAVFMTDSEVGEWAAQAVIRVPLLGGHRDQPQEDAEGYAVHIAMRRAGRYSA